MERRGPKRMGVLSRDEMKSLKLKITGEEKTNEHRAIVSKSKL